MVTVVLLCMHDPCHSSLQRILCIHCIIWLVINVQLIGLSLFSVLVNCNGTCLDVIPGAECWVIKLYRFH